MMMMGTRTTWVWPSLVSPGRNVLFSRCLLQVKTDIWQHMFTFQNKYKVYLCIHFLFIAENGKKKPALKKMEQICSIPFRSTLYPSYFHSFGLTENYIIFVEQAFKLDILKLATAYFRNVNWGSCLTFDKDDVVSKTTFFNFATPPKILLHLLTCVL